MGSTADKASGLANEATGKAKQGIGNVIGSDKLEAAGAAQELKGDAQKAVGDAKGRSRTRRIRPRTPSTKISKFDTTNGSARSSADPYRSLAFHRRARSFVDVRSEGSNLR
jgi:uncharacterized protein YjbJ (UPF0337 family)